MNLLGQIITWYAAGCFLAYGMLYYFLNSNKDALAKQSHPTLEMYGETRMSAVVSIFSWLIVVGFIVFYVWGWLIDLRGWYFRNIGLPLILWYTKRQVNKLLKRKGIKL